ncbi:S1C family serine protease [Nocardia sp. NBC_00565]|uniref:S1C family serine protease n=1 Tax=Nocardia sp. NBC_00565 TaxID=2975993 RepID=UPI002E7FE43E|nr:trypsin-like peptidase domain-containing protein [Nocardia sp. NBC_00565]WUC01290.1 S1C family serine protease [Nocardia sp. NBC_00565]
MDDERHRAPERPRVGGGGRALALFVAVMLAVAAFFGFRGELPDWSSPSGVADVAPALLEPLPPLDPMAVAQAVEPALVNISTSARPFGLGAAGSGIVLTADGQVLTSHHVVKGADTVTVTDVGNGTVYDAKVLGYDSTADIALLEMSGAADLVIARIGNSGELRLHEEVLAIGNAGGTGGTPTAIQGNITGLNSTIVALNASDMTRKSLTGMVEIAAPVSAGQSGGALADPGATVVGVITAASGETAREDGRTPNGYAVPIDTAMRVVRQIRSGTPTDTVHIGPTATLGVLISDARPSGARVDVALYGLPAYAAGLVDGDVITSIDGRDISSAKALRAAINVRKPDDTVQLGVLGTSGAQRTVSVVLALGAPN